MKSNFKRGRLRSSRQTLALALLAGSISLSAPLAAQNIDLSDFDVAATSDGFAILGAKNGDQSGFSISGAGDVNGDGYADILIGAKDADGPSGGRSYAGDSYVVFGKASGFSNFDLAAFDGGATAEGFAILGANARDYSGSSVSGAGDVNGDGYDDILISAYYADGPGDGRQRAGDSYVIFGKASGFTNIDLASLNGGATADGFAILGANVADQSGRSISGAGDVNGDGYADILIGARGASGPSYTRPSAGESYVIFGKASGFTNIDLASLDTGATADGFAILGAYAFDLSGVSVSGAGDVNGDGYADILIGARGASGPSYTRPGAGESYVIFGKAFGFSNIDLASLDGGATADGFAILGAGLGDGSGYSVSGAGDINGDGYADILLGAPFAFGPGNGRTFAGDSYVIFGKASGFSNIDLSSLDSGATSEGFAILGAGSDDRSGYSVSGAGDVNGDGYADILIGAYRSGGPSDERFFAGQSYVIFGKASGFLNIDLTSLDSGATVDGFSILGANVGDQSGKSLSGAGDVNGDGYADILISARGADGPSNERSTAGDSYVIFGKGSAASATYRSFAKIGDAHNLAIGITGDGSNDSTPDSRAFIDFADGGTTASLQTVTLNRSNAGISNLTDTGNVLWELTTDRIGWTNAVVTFKYTEAEISGLTEGSLKLFQATNPAGPWTELTSATLTQARNQISSDVSALGHFAIQGTPIDTTPPTSSASVSDNTQVGGDITGTYTADDGAGSGVDSVALFVFEPNGSWTSAGVVTGETFAFTPTQSGAAADGEYRFATSATDVDGNIETPPTGSDAGDVSVIYNDTSNSAFAYPTINDGTFVFPMTSTLDMEIMFSGSASGGPVTVGRVTGDVAPAGYDATKLIDENLAITGAFTGTASILWNFDPASDNALVGALDTVFQFETGTLSNSYPVTPSGDSLTINGVTSFSDWYAGNATSNTNEWMLLED